MSNKFCIEYAKRGTAGCKKCKQKIEKGILRIAKIVPNPFTESGGDMKQWFHVDCIFEQLGRARATTKVIDDPGDLDGWDQVNSDDQRIVLDHINKLPERSPAKKQSTPSKITNSSKSAKNVENSILQKSNDDANVDVLPTTTTDPNHKDNSFRQFRKLCADVADQSSYNSKTGVVNDFLTKGADGKSFKGDLYLWVKILIPGVDKRVYNLQSKQLIKLFSQIFAADQDAMLVDLEKGDVAETIRIFFESSASFQPAKKSVMSIFEAEAFLQQLAGMSREDEQINILQKMSKKCTGNDLKMIIRLIKHDLRINAGAKHVLEAVHPDAYQVFQASRNLKDVVIKVMEQKQSGIQSSLSVGINLMTPVLPMLAQACKSVEFAMKKCPNGMYAEIKYDGERVQIHKQENNFAYFSRSLKQVLPHKVAHLKEYIPKAFPRGNDIILDSEVLLIDTLTNKPLPFGTLSVHKKQAFNNANVCLFVFDCLMYNGESLMNKSIMERRKFLRKYMTEIPNRIMFSEMKEVYKPEDLKDLIMKTIKEGLEGLVLKDLHSVYEPGKRHWLKVKKDYLAEGAMADTADLVVLGAYFGTGNKGGMMSVFLMGCYDTFKKRWCTVTKVHGGHDDETLNRLQTELDMIKISKDVNKVPNWLHINTNNKSQIPDFVIRDPKLSQVWEITGAEFTKADIHTADGISIRFPRVTKIRRDKTWETATSLNELKQLFVESKQTSDIPDVLSSNAVENNDVSPEKSEVETNDNDYDADTDIDDDAEISSPIVSGKSTVLKKRKLDFDDTNEVSLKKPKIDKNITAKLMCKYGDKCYIKSSAHHKQYMHPKDKKPTKFGSELVDVFADHRIIISNKLEKRSILRRYVIAYDGEIVADYDVKRATVIIGEEDDARMSGMTDKCKFVVAQWLWDCIKLKRLIDFEPYLIQ